MLDTVESIQHTDRWNSFDRFHETTDTLVECYEKAGARAEVDAYQTGGRIDSGRWIIQQAQNVRSATIDVVRPFRERVADYKENPWHAVQWTASTPAAGLRCDLVVLEKAEDLDRMGADALTGKAVLTSLNIRGLMQRLADNGAAVIITDIPVTDNPSALAWTKFGWGAVPMAHATERLVGFVLSHRQGERLRRQLRQHGKLQLHVRVDARAYVGTHDVVSGLIEGRDDPQDEVWAIAHSGEPGAIDIVR